MITGAMSYERFIASNTGSTTPGFLATVNTDGTITAQQNIASLRVEKETVALSQSLLIPGLTDPVTEIRNLLFSQGQPGGSWIPSLSAAMIAANSFGSGVTDILDLSGNNNPFSQATPSSRGAWFREPKTGRRNLFVNTHFTGAVAGSPGTGPTNWNDIVSTGQIVSYDSSTGRLRLATSATRRGFSQAANMAINSVQTASVRVNVISGTLGVGRVLSVSSAIPAGASLQWQVNGVNVANSGVALPAGESLLSLRATTTTDPWTFNFEVGNGVGGTTTGDVELWEPQFETGSTRTNFQRVGLTAFDVTEAGQRDCYGVRLDGIDDFYQRAINFSGTDKVTLFVAMRRRSDAARGTVLELTSSIDSNNGAFHLTAPNAASATFGFESKGTTLRDAVITQAMGNPRIITAIGDIAGDLASIQVDNGTPTTNTGDQGSGNYANSTLYLGRRGGSSLSLNGDIFAVIAAGGDYTSATRQRVRTILSRITPTVNL